jgi:hypothetical protein
MSTAEIEAREAKYGEKMIEVKLRFWTDGLAEKDKILPRHAWGKGTLALKSNPSHGITASGAVLFNSWDEIPSALEKLLDAEGVTIHTS